MGWTQMELETGWQWRLLNKEMDYIMSTFLTPCPPTPRFVKVRLEEWKGSLKKSVWERELTQLDCRNPYDPRPTEIRKSVEPVISNITDWADSLVVSYMDMFVTGLMAFRLGGGRPKAGELRWGWKCVYVNAEEGDP